MEGPDKFQKVFFSRQSLYRFLVMPFMSVMLFCSLPFFAPLGTTAFLFSSTPLALLGARENKKWMTLGLLAASAFLFLLHSLFSSWISPLLFLYFFVIQGFLCFGLTLPLGKLESGGESLLFCIIASITAKTTLLVITVTLTGHNPFVLNPEMLAQAYADVLSEGGQRAALMRESLDQMVILIPYMAPSMIFISSMLDSFLNYKLCESLQRKHEVKFPALPSFAEWRFPQSLLWALVFSFVLPFFTDHEQPLWLMIEINLKILVFVFFFLQGLSLVWWWLSKLGVNLLLRAIIVTALVMPILGLWVVALGVGDICLDFRAKKRSKE